MLPYLQTRRIVSPTPATHLQRASLGRTGFVESEQPSQRSGRLRTPYICQSYSRNELERVILQSVPTCFSRVWVEGISIDWYSEHIGMEVRSNTVMTCWHMRYVRYEVITARFDWFDTMKDAPLHSMPPGVVLTTNTLPEGHSYWQKLVHTLQ